MSEAVSLQCSEAITRTSSAASSENLARLAEGLENVGRSGCPGGYWARVLRSSALAERGVLLCAQQDLQELLSCLRNSKIDREFGWDLHGALRGFTALDFDLAVSVEESLAQESGV